MSERAHPGRPPVQGRPPADAGCKPPQQRLRLFRERLVRLGECGQLRPEGVRVGGSRRLESGEPRVPLGGDERLPALFEAPAIAVEHDRAHVVLVQREVLVSHGDERARAEAQQVERVRQRGRLVEVVDAPREPPLGVAPAAEVLHVQVADGEQLGRLHQLGRRLLLEPREPEVVRRAQEERRRLGHPLVLAREVVVEDGAELRAQPALVGGRRLDGVHGSTASSQSSLRPQSDRAADGFVYRTGSSAVVVLSTSGPTG